MWRFSIEHQSGKDNHFSDATSRNPASRLVDDDDDDVSDDLTLDCIRIAKQDDDGMENQLISIGSNSADNIRSIIWALVKQHSTLDKCIQDLVHIIEIGFPNKK